MKVDICDVCFTAYEAKDLICSQGEAITDPDIAAVFPYALKVTCRKCAEPAKVALRLVPND